MSGLGLPRVTSSPVTMWSNRENKALWLAVLTSKWRLWDEVATAMGTLCAWRCRTSLSAPVWIETETSMSNLYGRSCDS
jgi:hypothetical protein